MEFAIVPESPALQQGDPAWDLVVSALNVQVTQHAAPAWNLQATVSSYASPELVPVGAIPIVIMKSPQGGVEGCHKWQSGQGSAVVSWAPNGDWSVAASHEIIETLVDPTLEATKTGPDPDSAAGSGTVEFLVEVCDPCIGTTYQVLPGAFIEVSDFCLPAYYAQGGYGPFTRCGQSLNLWMPGALVSLTGYLTWSKPDGWRQLSGGSITGPVSQEELLANAMRHGRRGAVDRFKKFAKPPHLRAGRRRATNKALKPKTSFTKNKALLKWVTDICAE
jgi:hypothetical protein